MTDLHVLHGWGGGIAGWVRDYCGAAEGRQLVLRSRGVGWQNGRTIELTSEGARERRRLRSPVRALSHGNAEYARYVSGWCSHHRVSHILISSLIGHDLMLFDLGIPITYVIHDLFPFCTTLLAETPAGRCRRCNQDDHRRCTELQPTKHRFGPTGPGWSRKLDALRAAVQADHVRIVAPSRFAADVWRDISGIAATVAVIPHGIAMPRQDVWSGAGERLRVLVLGSLTQEKGLDVYRSLLPALKDDVDICILGCGRSGREFRRIAASYDPYYDRDRLVERVRAILPGVALLLNTAPETFGYVVAELKAMCVPVVALAGNAYAEQLSAEEAVILDRPPSAPELLRILRDTDWAALHANLTRTTVRSAADMVQDYERGMLREEKPALRNESFTQRRRAYPRLAGAADLAAGVLFKRGWHACAAALSRISQSLGLPPG